MCLQNPKPQPSPTFAFSHPAVYAFRVQDRVDALDRFIQKELYPKLLRLREEHSFIEHQLQRTMNKEQFSAELSPMKTPTARHKKSAQFRQQAWSWKRTSKRQELSRFESFFELAKDLRRISKELNPRILRLTVLLQRNQSKASRKYQSSDFVLDEGVGTKEEDVRLKLRHQCLSQEYHDVYRENIRVSKSIKERTEKLMTTNITPTKDMDDASTISSLMIFGHNFIACSTCQARFHKDYINALIVPIPTKCENNPNTFICFHCWEEKEFVESGKQSHEMHIVKDENQLTPNQIDGNKKHVAEEIPILERTKQKNVMQNVDLSKATEIMATGGAIASNNDGSGTSIASSNVYQCVDSMPSFDNGLMKLGESLSPCIVGESRPGELQHNHLPLLHPPPSFIKNTKPRNIETIQLQMQMVDSSNNTSSCWRSTDFSIGENSILESDHEATAPSEIVFVSSALKYRMVDTSNIDQAPLEKNNNWNQYESSDSSFCSDSLFSETSNTSYRSPIPSAPVPSKVIKSAMKKSFPSMKSSSTTVGSPKKVNDFPFDPFNLRKNVRFQEPLEECRVYDPTSDPEQNIDALLDSSFEIVGKLENFCTWRTTFMNAFEQKAS